MFAMRSQTTYLLVIFIIHACHGLDRRLPPSITKDLQEVLYFRENIENVLVCEATGIASPEFSWYKKGQLLSAPGEHGNLVIQEGKVLRIKQSSKKDEGEYYCEARNSLGAARSNTSTLIMGTLFSSPRKTEILSVPEHSSFKRKCGEVTSSPKASFKWWVIHTSPENLEEINTDRRVFMNEHGTLFFNYVIKSDERGGEKYKCDAYNKVTDSHQGSEYFTLRVTEKAETRDLVTPPKLMYASGEMSGYVVKSLLGDNVTLSCFYSARPITSECKYSWYKRLKNGAMVDLKRKTKNYGIVVEFERVREEDGGVYRCTCTNKGGSTSRDLTLVVEVKPMIRSPEDMLVSQNATEGDHVVFNCRPHAVPSPTITWRIKDVVVREDTLQSRWSMSDDMTQLRVRKVCKECHDVITDVGVIQCHAKNGKGAYTYSAYLNVLKRTTLTDRPKDQRVSYKRGEGSVSFFCSATTDDLTPLSLRWLFFPKGSQYPENVHTTGSKKVILENDNQTLMIKVANSTEWTNFQGTFMCLADNGYSRENASASLVVVMPTTKPPFVDTSVMKSVISWWWLLLLLALLLLLLLLLLCCCCLWRGRGGVYKVDAKERLNGNDPEKELKEDDFRDYQRPSTDFLKGSRASLGSSIPMNSDDEGSLNEYGDIDAGKFGEDGSFIGDYNTDRRNKTNTSNYGNGNGNANGNVFNSFGTNGYQRV